MPPPGPILIVRITLQSEVRVVRKGWEREEGKDGRGCILKPGKHSLAR